MTEQTRVIRLAWLAALIACLVMPGVTALAVEATINVEIPGGKWKSVRLKSLPQGASVALTIESSDALRVIVVDGTQLRTFPKTRPLFEAAVEKRLGFSIVIPRGGDYFVVFDNRKSPAPREVKLVIKAEPAPRPPKPAPESKPEKQDETRAVTGATPPG